MRFLLSRRWAAFAVLVVLLAYGCYLLGRWQFHRLHDRETTNAVTRTNLAADPVPVGQVLAVDRAAGPSAEWKRVTATGTYLPDQSVVVRYQTRDGASGVDVVTPLRTTDGPLLLVDRGWVRTGNTGASSVPTPAPPSGQVTVLGYVRADATGDSTAVTDRSTRAVSSRAIGRGLDGPVLRGFVDAARETPAADEPLVPVERPDLGNGPHFFYGLQWWFFGVLAVFGFGYLAWDERKRLARGESPGSLNPRRRRAGPEPSPTDSAGDGAGEPATGSAASRRPPAASSPSRTTPPG